MNNQPYKSKLLFEPENESPATRPYDPPVGRVPSMPAWAGHEPSSQISHESSLSYHTAVGQIKICPQCGLEIPSFLRKCHGCGYVEPYQPKAEVLPQESAHLVSKVIGLTIFISLVMALMVLVGPAYALLCAGGFIALFGVLCYLIIAFETSPLWGVACVFLPITTPIFFITHFQDTIKTVLLVIIGASIAYIGFSQAGPLPWFVVAHWDKQVNAAVENEIKPKPMDVALTANDLAAAFGIYVDVNTFEDERGNARFKDKIVAVTGPVEQIYLSSDDPKAVSNLVTLRGANLTVIDCHFSDDHKNQLAWLDEGDDITIKGKYSGVFRETVELSQARINGMDIWTLRQEQVHSRHGGAEAIVLKHISLQGCSIMKE